MATAINIYSLKQIETPRLIICPVQMGDEIERVELDISEQNTKSIRLAERLGFTFEGWLKNHARNFVTNEISSSALFSLTDASQLKVRSESR